MRRIIFILVPSPFPTGPIKGAYALANALALSRRVVLVFLKDGPGVNAPLSERVEVVSLSQVPGGRLGRLGAYRKLLENAGGRADVGSVSMCLSADWINMFCRRSAVTCASVRGNLLQNYQLDYGWCGRPLALVHMLSLRTFDHVVAMTRPMAKQLESLAGLRPHVIGNFVDEAALDCRRPARAAMSGPLRFIFVGSLSMRKKPDLLVSAMGKIQDGVACLDIVGEGPLRTSLERLIVSRGLNNRIILHGQVADPYAIMAGADAFVLPSCSEGVSRAALEALHLGVPCVLRDVDGNAELLTEPNSGALFQRDEDLLPTMLKVAALARARSVPKSLLPPVFQQSVAAGQYLTLLDQVS